MVDVQSLVAKAKAFNSSREEKYRVCIAPDKLGPIRMAAARLEQAKNLEAAAGKRDLEQRTEFVGDIAPAGAKSAVDAAQAELDELYAGLDADDVIVLVFGKLPEPGDPSEGTALEKLVAGYTHDNTIDKRGLRESLASGCYRRAESIDGDVLDITWDEARDGFLSDGDRNLIHDILTTMHRMVAYLDFSQPTSGNAATS